MKKLTNKKVLKRFSKLVRKEMKLAHSFKSLEAASKFKK